VNLGVDSVEDVGPDQRQFGDGVRMFEADSGPLQGRTGHLGSGSFVSGKTIGTPGAGHSTSVSGPHMPFSM
jgi:hypothetical protein